ncbi:hypothetical protein GCM10018790_57500 [Kitasatospora xanthocidica]|uniref:hypothetical protein n=1 Tax=Kitasatospora xanthocidica TaxID=83382 RepID=UPI0019BD2C65|nr:hypothetical protein [Kitasatospora xanthocidica]GHF72155.1 hypothetical protein GCM10018790_57500 [Kitasatospora xanthocidica]
MGAARPVAQAEAALVRHYRRLVRLAYLALPADRDRHSRVLAAHAAVQRALPTRWALRSERQRRNDPDHQDGLGHQDSPDHQDDAGHREDRTHRNDPAADGTTDPVYAALRLRVLRAALRPRPAARLLAPRVWGLRLFTPHGGEEDAALAHALAALDAPARAAFALRTVEGLSTDQAAGVLRQAGVAQPMEAVAAAAGVASGPAPALPAFDPCAVRVQPTDLLRRRRTLTAALTVGVLGLTTTAAVLGGPGSGDGSGSATGARSASAPPPPGAVDPTRLLRVAPDAWQHTARIDFSAWPARGDRREDATLLRRALTAWAQPGPQTHAEPGTDTTPPAEAPHLLFAGTVDGTGVVVLYDGLRIARYTDGPQGGLDLARADDSDVTTAGAVALRRQGPAVRYLLAPWVESAETRRIDQPDVAARPLDHPDGLTAPAPGGGLADCQGATVLQLHSSPVIAEKHAFLLADLGGVVPAHLTYTPPPDRTPSDRSPSAQPDRSPSAQPAQPDHEPREATGQDALLAWARAGCAVPDGKPGVKQLNLWAFAVQALPQNAGSASWVCLRADRWTGDGSAASAVVLPAVRGAQRTGGGPGRACSRFEQDTVAWTWWRSPQGTEYVLAAGSRRVTRLTVKGPDWSADRAAPDHTLAVERPARAAVQVEALLDNGSRIGPPH